MSDFESRIVNSLLVVALCGIVSLVWSGIRSIGSTGQSSGRRDEGSETSAASVSVGTEAFTAETNNFDRMLGLNLVKPGSIGGAGLWALAAMLVFGAFHIGVATLVGDIGGASEETATAWARNPLWALLAIATWRACTLRGLVGGWRWVYLLLSVTIVPVLITAIVLSRENRSTK